MNWLFTSIIQKSGPAGLAEPLCCIVSAALAFRTKFGKLGQAQDQNGKYQDQNQAAQHNAQAAQAEAASAQGAEVKAF